MFKTKFQFKPKNSKVTKLIPIFYLPFLHFITFYVLKELQIRILYIIPFS